MLSNTKKFLITSLVLFSFFANDAKAVIDKNLYYGMINDNQVRELQEFLIGKGLMSGSATGNFYSITLGAVKSYQKSKNISTTGTVGPLTREAIKKDLQGSPASTSSTTAAPVSFTGSLELSKSTTYGDQPVSAPQIRLKLADFVLTNKTSEAVNIKKLEANILVGADKYLANLYINNMYVVYGDNITSVQSAVAYNNYWQTNYELAPEKSIGISLYGDINSSIPADSIINPSFLISGTSTTSNTNVYTNQKEFLIGQKITFKAGSLSVSAKTSSTDQKITTANQKVLAGEFSFSANAQSYTITDLNFVISDSSAASLVANAFLQDSTTGEIISDSITPTSYNKGYYLNFKNLNIPVLINATKNIKINYNLGKVYSPEATNKNIAPILVYVKAKNSKENFIDGTASNYNSSFFAAYGGVTLPFDGAAPSSLLAFKSIPIFSAESKKTSASNGTSADIYTFSIKADSKGDVSIKQITFPITISDPNNSYPYLKNFSFYKGGSNYSGSVSIGKVINNNYLGLSSGNSIGIGTSYVIVIFNEEETIKAGATNTYTLRAFTNNFVSVSGKGASSVAASISSDSAISTNRYLRSVFINTFGLAPEAASVYVKNYYMLWSDKSAVDFPAHSDSNGYSTKDWYNSYGLSSLPSASQSVEAK